MANSTDTCGSCLPGSGLLMNPGNFSGNGPLPLNGTVTTSGPAVTSITLEYYAYPTANGPGSGTWIPITGIVVQTSQSPSGTEVSWSATLPSAALAGGASGEYDIVAVAADANGDLGYSNAVHVTVALLGGFPAETYVGLESVGTANSGPVTLSALPDVLGNIPDTVTFLIAPVTANGSSAPSPGVWSTVGTAPLTTDDLGNTLPYTITFNTKNPDGTPIYPDGTYYVLVQAQDANGDIFYGSVTTIVIDNTAPSSVTLANPGSQLTGVVALSATAQDATSGVATVRFQVAPSGSASWTTIAVAITSPYTASFDTRALADGLYDLRVYATDGAGNLTDSVVITGVSISNPTPPGAGNGLALTNFVLPATNVTMLGVDSTGGSNETWAAGFSTAPAPTVDGAPLYATMPGAPQLVLLRYTDATGWQVADVLRNADGSPFTVPTGARIAGEMVASGEAWIALAPAEGAGIWLFHRQPAGQFLLDSADSSPAPGSPRAPATGVASMFTGNGQQQPQLALAVAADGSVYGVLTNPAQAQASSPTTVTVDGVAVSLTTKLDYATLQDGTWTLVDGAASLKAAPNLPSTYIPASGEVLTLQAASPTGLLSPTAGAPLEATGWLALAVTGTTSGAGAPASPLILATYDGTQWTFINHTGLDVLDRSGAFAGLAFTDTVTGITAVTGGGAWVGVSVGNGADQQQVVALLDPTGSVIGSWCSDELYADSAGCGFQLDANHPAVLPSAVFDGGAVALGLAANAIDVYRYGSWTTIAAPGFVPPSVLGQPPLFTGPQDGWLAGADSVAQLTAQALPSPLASWPEANQATLLAVALPPAGAGIGTSGALAVGLDSTALHYDASAGWLVDPVPGAAQGLNLLGVAFSGPTSAVAVGSYGTILDWNGATWSADPQSSTITQLQLNAVAFAADGEGWAVGVFGTILHFDGTAWSSEQLDATDSGADITSVTVAGGRVFAVAAGTLIERRADGTWAQVDLSGLPDGGVAAAGRLTLVSGLPDGGLVAAGHSVVLTLGGPGAPFAYANQPLQGEAVALSAFRDPSTGRLLAFVSVAPDLVGPSLGFPTGDGELMVETPSGWQDLSRSQYPQRTGTPADGAPQPDPVLAVAAGADGTSAWAVGGYAGTPTAAGLGSPLPLPSRPFAWQTSSIWRYDAGGPTPAPTLTQATTSLPAQPSTVSFAFFSSALCIWECSQVQGAQPFVNMQAAAAEIAAFAAQPGGPAFAMEGGDAVGPIDPTARSDGNGAVDLANLPGILSPLGALPLFAAYGPLDAVPSANPSVDTTVPWGDAFAQSPAPFGLGSLPAGITVVSSGGHDGSVNLYYSFDVAQNGGTLRVIVIDNAAGSLEASSAGQTAWLQGQLAAAQAAGLPVVVFAALPLISTQWGGPTTDGDQVATMLAASGVLAVFTTSETQTDQTEMVPFTVDPTVPQLPQYEGATLGYQQTQNNGVVWYYASVDTVNRTVTVQGIPVLQSLALEPLSGLTVAQSSTLDFRAVGERPPGSLPATANGAISQGYANYAGIPASSCPTCIGPSYSFTSSNPAIGTFVVPSAPGSLFPLLNASGHPIPSTKSGLFCAFNYGTTTVSVTSGLLTSSLTVTVTPGAIGTPCGTVSYLPNETVVPVPRGGSLAPTPPPPAPAPAPVVSPAVTPPPPALAPPPPPPAAAPSAPAAPGPPPPPPPPVSVPVATIPPQPPAAVLVAAVVLPLITPPVTPVPPGGATAPSAARREEKARKAARQSAFVIRPAGASADWFYAATGLSAVLVMFVVAVGLNMGSRRRQIEAWEPLHIRDRGGER